MKKPELKDFGLTEELLDLNKKQREKYYNKLAEQRENNCANAKNIKIFIIVVSLIITFIVLIINITKEFQDEVSFIVLCGCGTWGAIGVVHCFLTLDEPLWHISDSKEREIRTQFMDLNLDNAVEKYNKEMSEYEYYLEKCSIDFWNSLDGFEFEKEIAKLYRKQGYDATVTSATGDGGVDIILRRNGERIAVQCKHHAKPVGPNDVRALQGVVAAQNYSKGIFVSLNGYTSSVYYEVRSGRVKIDLLELNDILQMAKGDDINPVKPQNKPKKDEPIIPLPNIDLEKELIIKLYQSLDDENINMLSGKTVSHTKFGNGIITFITERKYIEVYFPDIEEEKKFVFPNAFADKFIVPVDFKIVRKE